jgi:hypothetical protein
MKFLNFYFCGSFLPFWIRIPNTDPDPDSQTQLNTDPVPDPQLGGILNQCWGHVGTDLLHPDPRIRTSD